MYPVNDNVELRKRRSTRLFALLPWLALAWIQVSAAAHQFEHLAGEPEDVCGICLQLEQHDEIVPTSDAAIPAPATNAQVAGLHDASHLRTSAAHYSPRAPPAL